MSVLERIQYGAWGTDTQKNPGWCHAQHNDLVLTGRTHSLSYVQPTPRKDQRHWWAASGFSLTTGSYLGFGYPLFEHFYATLELHCFSHSLVNFLFNFGLPLSLITLALSHDMCTLCFCLQVAGLSHCIYAQRPSPREEINMAWLPA